MKNNNTADTLRQMGPHESELLEMSHHPHIHTYIYIYANTHNLVAT